MKVILQALIYILQTRQYQLEKEARVYIKNPYVREIEVIKKMVEQLKLIQHYLKPIYVVLTALLIMMLVTWVKSLV